MHRAPPFALAVALLLLCSCTHNPRIVSGTESDYLLRLRAEYLASNPDGEFNAFIERGEVVKGMDILEVLASWGHPIRREKRGDTTETWLYQSIDQDNKDTYEYMFVFRDKVLAEWELTRNLAAGGSVPIPEVQSSQSLTKGAVAASASQEVPKK